MNSKSSNTSSESFSSLVQIDDSLEGRLKAHGISRRNIRSIIHEVFSDENVLKLLRADNETPELDFTDVRMTRSKQSQSDQDDPNFLSIDIDDSSFGHEPSLSDLQYVEDYQLSGPSMLEPQASTSENTCDTTDTEFDWRKWLDEFTSENDAGNKEDYDSDDDPDFNFLAELDDPDEEDYRNDCATRISKKELKSLTLEKVDPPIAVGANMKTKLRRLTDDHAKQADEYTNNVGPERKDRAMTAFFKSKTLKSKLQLLRTEPALERMLRKARRKTSMRVTTLTFTEKQMETLQQQMQQHLQLLAQTAILSDSSAEYTNQAVQYTHELLAFKCQSIEPNLSSFNIAFLQDTMNLLQKCYTSGTSADAVPDEKRIHGVRQEKMGLIANSQIFMYRELLPDFDQPKKLGKKTFSENEDSLIALGLAEMSGCCRNTFECISIYMLPIYTGEQLAKHVNRATNTKTYKAFNNPINKYKILGVLPPPCKVVTNVPLIDAKSPIQMIGVVPAWVDNFKERSCNIFRIRNHNTCDDGGVQICHSMVVQNKAGESPTGRALYCKNFSDAAKGYWQGDELTANSNIIDKPAQICSKVSAKNVKLSRTGSVKKVWTKCVDEKILYVCKEHGGPSDKALSLLTKLIPGQTKQRVKNRLCELLSILHDGMEYED